MVTVLDLHSSDPRLIIDAGIEIGSLGMTADTIIVVGEGKIVTWKLPADNCALNTRANIDDSVQTTKIVLPPFRDPKGVRMSISPDLRRVGVAGHLMSSSSVLGIYDLSTGRCLVRTSTTGILHPRFAWDGREVWCEVYPHLGSCAITEDTEHDTIKIGSSGETEYPPVGVTLPWQSSRGYQITDDGWVLSPTQKRLLWMLPHWRTFEACRIWSGRFLGLSQGGPSEVVILEFPE